MVDASAISNEEVVCEAGTGNGILTKQLCLHAKKVISYEVDSSLFIKAKLTLSSFANLELLNQDPFIKKNEVHFDVFVSNLPYSKSRDALEWLSTKRFSRAILMVQKEFADKLIAEPGTPKYRSISAIASHCFKIEQLFNVGQECFDPPPLVESTVIRANLKNAISKDIISQVNMLFSQRNRLASTIAARFGARVDYGDKRVDQLEPHQIIALARMMIP
jgi:16S rRNA (adenine1518-N6/adenine1519-N6)-dimethyltransferase